MEMRQEITKDLNEASRSVTKTIQDTCISATKSGSTSSSDRELEARIILGRNANHANKPESSRSGHKRTKSKSAQSMINLDELIDNASGRLSEELASTLSRTPSASLGFSFSLAGATMPTDDILDVVRNKSNNTDGGIKSPMVDEDLESGSQKKIISKSMLPISLKFSNVKYKVVVKGEKISDPKKYILQGVTGSVHPREVLALMGPSGGGKTTLLNLLSGRVKNNVPGGSITYNNKPYSKSLKCRIGFVLQDDIVFPHLTVKEMLTYSALLRLPSMLTRKQKEKRAMDVIFQLGLERCQDTVIGGAFVRGISGGERKRVCIGNEILLNPSLLFLDEPTSGLDSTTADRIIQMLHDIAKAGKTVITTVHQPSSRLFLKFDKLILLGQGSLLYFGKASEAMLYFSSIGCSPLIAMNPAEFLIDLANGNINEKLIPSKLEEKVAGESKGNKLLGRPSPIDVHDYLVEAYETRVAHIEKKKLLKPTTIEDDWEMQGQSVSREWGASWWEQYCILFWRGLKQRRHDYLSWIRVAQVLSTAVVLGLLWWQSSVSSPKELQDQAGLLFFISVFWGFFPVLTAIFTFPLERAMLTKERSVDMYKLSAYFVARTASDLPLDLILPIFFLLIVYFMGGLKPSSLAFSLSMLTIFLTIAAAQGLGLAIGASVMDVKKATTLASVVVMTSMLTGGFFVQRVPSFISWIRYISFNYHTYRLLLEIQYNCAGSGSGSGLCGFPFIRELRLDGGGKEVSLFQVDKYQKDFNSIHKISSTVPDRLKILGFSTINRSLILHFQHSASQSHFAIPEENSEFDAGQMGKTSGINNQDRLQIRISIK